MILSLIHISGNFREAMEKGEISADEFNQAIMDLGMTDVAKEAATSTSTIEGAMAVSYTHLAYARRTGYELEQVITAWAEVHPGSSIAVEIENYTADDWRQLYFWTEVAVEFVCGRQPDS